MPLLPWLAFGLVVGALQPDAVGIAWARLFGTSAFSHPFLLWWLIGLPLAALSVIVIKRFPFAARWLLFSSACILGMAWRAPLIVTDNTSTQTGLIAATGEVAGVRWQGFSQGFQLRPDSMQLPSGFPVPDRLWIDAPPMPDIRSGDEVAVRGVLSEDLRGQRCDAVEIDRLLARENGPRGWAWRAVDAMGERRELAGALLIGQGSPPEKQAFREAGLLHVLAVSGMHFAIAAALTMWLLRLGGVPWLPRTLLLSVLLLGYLWLTGANPATQRAAAMGIAVVIASLAARDPHPLAAVSLAALALIVIDPSNATDRGFQLSLVAVIGIVTLGMELVALRRKFLPLSPWALDRPTWRGVLFTVRSSCDGFCIGAAACLATAPLIAWYYGTANPWSPLASVVVAPPTTAALWLGLPCLVLGGFFPNGPWEGLYAGVQGSLDALHRSVEASAALPGAVSHVPYPSPWAILLWPALFIPARGRWALLKFVGLALLAILW